MTVKNNRQIFAMCAVRTRMCSRFDLRVGSSGSIPVGKVCVNESKCERELDAADTGAVSFTQMRALMVFQMTPPKWHSMVHVTNIQRRIRTVSEGKVMTSLL